MPRRFLALAAGTLVLGLAGYAGYLLYPRFDLPAGTGAGLLVLAVAAGIAAFFSPCSFGLLVTMLARPLSQDATADKPPLRRALLFAAALSAGATVFLSLVGAAMAAGAGVLFADITFTSTTGRVLRVVVGAGLVVLGLVQVGRVSVDLRCFEPATQGFLRRQAGLRRRHPVAGYGLFGFGYLLAGFG